ncbi:MAG: murein transglycosylase [Micavibrio sp. TMED27]|nr:murein transglycosylase [Micavibrio sp.]OUT92465.1 MAG: murein transglycosylase [Micavibrio sp. TMED27]|tara:strand:+ start:4377 stop:5552 length:1176 start_codon:yes stop_codon:yes gene_type:complete
MMIRSFLLLSACLLIPACSDRDSTPQQKTEPKRAELTLIPASFNDLPGWKNDDLKSFVPAFNKSCERLLKQDPQKNIYPMAQAGTNEQWQRICYSFNTASLSSSDKIREFIELHLTPRLVLSDGEEQGLFTGYYEASLRGSRTRGGPYQIPLFQRANDLVMVHLGEFRDSLKGQRIAGRVVDGTLKPYESREEIVSGNWPHNDKVLVWVDNAVDAFFVQIQGSGIVTLNDGSTMRVGYAGQNGHPYYAIGRELINAGHLTKETVSMQSIRQWLENNPTEAGRVMNTNPSYVFFRELKGDGPLGAEGVALTAGRSLAVDRSYIPYGLPIWTDIDAPIEGQTPRLQKLMMAQDTGGAIRGPVRGDVFWGYGKAAEQLAGPMKSKGRYWVLLPK